MDIGLGELYLCFWKIKYFIVFQCLFRFSKLNFKQAGAKTKTFLRKIIIFKICVKDKHVRVVINTLAKGNGKPIMNINFC